MFGHDAGPVEVVEEQPGEAGVDGTPPPVVHDGDDGVVVGRFGWAKSNLVSAGTAASAAGAVTAHRSDRAAAFVKLLGTCQPVGNMVPVFPTGFHRPRQVLPEGAFSEKNCVSGRSPHHNA